MEGVQLFSSTFKAKFLLRGAQRTGEHKISWRSLWHGLQNIVLGCTGHFPPYHFLIVFSCDGIGAEGWNCLDHLQERRSRRRFLPLELRVGAERYIQRSAGFIPCCWLCWLWVVIPSLFPYIEQNADLTGLLELRVFRENEMVLLVRAVARANLKNISDLVRHSECWAFYLSIYDATVQGRSFLDFRFRLCLHGSIDNVHFLSIPLQESHTSLKMEMWQRPRLRSSAVITR